MPHHAIPCHAIPHHTTPSQATMCPTGYSSTRNTVMAPWDWGGFIQTCPCFSQLLAPQGHHLSLQGHVGHER